MKKSEQTVKQKEYAMEHQDEHEMLIEYSEMTAFNFNSKEFQEVRNDYLECKDFLSKCAWMWSNFVSKFTPAKNY